MSGRKIIFCLVTILFWFSLYAYVPQLTYYAREMGASYQLIGIIAGSYGLTQTLLRIPLGITSDLLGKRKMFIVMGAFVTVLSALMVYLAPHPYTLLLARCLAGVAAATWVTFTVMFTSYYPAAETTRAMGIIFTSNRIGMLSAMLGGGIVSSYYGMRSIFLLSIIVGSIAFLLSLSIREEKRPAEQKAMKPKDLTGMIRNREIVYLSGLGAMTQLITYGTTFGFTPLVASNLAATSFQLSMLTMVFIIPQIVFSPLTGTLFIRVIGERNTLLAGFAVSTVICILTPYAPGLGVLYILQALNGFGASMTFPLLIGLVLRNVPVQSRTSAMGFFQATFGLGMILGPILLGGVSDRFGLLAGFLAIGLFGMAAFIATLFYNRAVLIPAKSTV